MPKLDPSSDEFREAGHRLIDWVADYLDGVGNYPVIPPVQPGDVAKQFADAPQGGKSYDELAKEFAERIVPAVTHWNHPAFFSYFSITGSQAGILAELLTAALNINGMVWRSSPATTELETVTLNWLRNALGLPDGLFGIINDTASINSFLGLAAAREAIGLNIRSDGMTGRDLPALRVYCSEHAHSSIDKAALALGLGVQGVMRIEADDAYRMKPDALRRTIEKDIAAGVRPCAIASTLGTTSIASVDPLEEIGAIAKEHKVWLHVDAAYAGSATIAPEFRWLWNGIEAADSIVVNPHKWLFTPIDCSVLYTKHPGVLRNAFSPAETPPYLTSTDKADVNYMDFGLQLGRRFRALKLWMVMEHYGIERMAAVIRDHVALAQRLTAELQKRPDIELLAPQMFSVIVFRKVVRGDEDATERLNAEVVERMNASGRVFVSQTRLQGRFGIRIAIGNGATEWEHVARVLEFL